jgi:hypothetical protein
MTKQHCPYNRCILGCYNKIHHKIAYAKMRTKKKKIIHIKSTKVNWDKYNEIFGKLE